MYVYLRNFRQRQWCKHDYNVGECGKLKGCSLQIRSIVDIFTFLYCIFLVAVDSLDVEVHRTA